MRQFCEWGPLGGLKVMLDSKTIMGALLSIVLYRRWCFEAFMRSARQTVRGLLEPYVHFSGPKTLNPKP